MAQIAVKNDTSILKIRKFLGLNENPDGDTTLENGEMAEMRNFRITQDNHLQIRPGYKTILDLHTALEELDGEDVPQKSETHVRGVWHGMAGGSEHTLSVYGGRIWDINIETGTAVTVGTSADAPSHFFGFDGKVYLLNGVEYKSWDGTAGTEFADVEGYIPLVQTATAPEGNGTLVENVNRLNGKRRVQFSPDGTAKDFVLPEDGLYSIDKVLVNGSEVSSGVTLDAPNGVVKFSTAPGKGVNTVEVFYTKSESGAREEVTKMRFSELFNGQTDTRVFLYGDGSNRTIYSGVRLDTGRPSAEYFPDLYEAAVGESNTPITALVRQYSQMMAFKPNSAWVIQSAALSLESGMSTAAFYVLPVNRQFGNEAMGQVRLLENNPVTLDVNSAYQWRGGINNSGYVSNSESNAKRISDKVSATMRSFRLSDVKTFNMKGEHEFWFIYGGKALILNYANNAWYLYTNIPLAELMEVDGEQYGFADDGRVLRVSRDFRNDDGQPIDAYAATGAMDFDKDWLMKYSPMIYVAMQPESRASVTVTVETNRKGDYPDKIVAYNLATFSHVDFNHFSFATNRKPQVKRIKMKVKKATFYRLIFKSNSASATATVIETDVKMRYAGSVK